MKISSRHLRTNEDAAELTCGRQSRGIRRSRLFARTNSTIRSRMVSSIYAVALEFMERIFGRRLPDCGERQWWAVARDKGYVV
jgi:hypothetical protein